jgi:hypothetical protein
MYMSIMFFFKILYYYYCFDIEGLDQDLHAGDRRHVDERRQVKHQVLGNPDQPRDAEAKKKNS